MQPPLGRVDAVGTAVSRADDGFSDIGAYEYAAAGDDDTPPADGGDTGDIGASTDDSSGGSSGCWIELLVRNSSSHEH